MPVDAERSLRCQSCMQQSCSCRRCRTRHRQAKLLGRCNHRSPMDPLPRAVATQRRNRRHRRRTRECCSSTAPTRRRTRRCSMTWGTGSCSATGTLAGEQRSLRRQSCRWPRCNRESHRTFHRKSTHPDKGKGLVAVRVEMAARERSPHRLEGIRARCTPRRIRLADPRSLAAAGRSTWHARRCRWRP